MTDELTPIDTSMKYVNSKGDTIDLNEPPFIGEKSNNLFSYKWEYITQGQAIQKIVKFEKYMIEKKFHVLISGDSEADYMDNLEKFLQLTDVDINNNTMGRLYIGNYYLECYLFASNKSKRYLNTTKTLIECSAICERGNWQREGLFEFKAGMGGFEGEQIYTNTGISYPYDYNYDYSAPFGKNTLANESYMATDFEMTFYGAMENPSVTIGGNLYEFVGVTLNEKDYLVLNSQKKTAVLNRRVGKVYEQVNVFKYRNKEHYIYEKIKGGGNLVLKDVNAHIDVKLFYERSEPKWSRGIWT